LLIEHRPPSPLDDIGWRADGELYRTLTRINLPPPVADEMELWQIAVLLGADEPSTGIDQERWDAEQASLVDRARVIHDKHHPEEVEDLTDQVMRQMGIRAE